MRTCQRCLVSRMWKLPFLVKKYFSEDYQHELDSGLKTKIQQFYLLKDLGHWLIFSAPRSQDCWKGSLLGSAYKNLNRENKQVWTQSYWVKAVYTHEYWNTLPPWEFWSSTCKYFRFWQEMNLCAIASHQRQLVLCTDLLIICRARWVLLLDENQFALYTQQVPLRGQRLGLLLQDWHLQAVICKSGERQRVQIAEVHQAPYCPLACWNSSNCQDSSTLTERQILTSKHQIQ